LADGNSTQPGVLATLDEHTRKDERVRLVRLEKNFGISDNTNEAIAMARGEFIAFLDHDDVLAPDMLFEVVTRLNARHDADIVYFDEDLLSEDGSRRFNPLLKPDWSPDLLLSANYLTHAVLRRDLVKEVGRLDPATDGAQDWDYILRCVERTTKIEHIPRILY